MGKIILLVLCVFQSGFAEAGYFTNPPPTDNTRTKISGFDPLVAGKMTPDAPPFSENFAPVNDDPCNAVLLTVNSACVYSPFTNLAATATAGVPDPLCSSYNGADVWFRIIVPAGGSLIIDTQTGTVTDGGMALYTGTCSGLTEILCDDDGSFNGAMPMITATGLTPGNTVWVRFWAFGTFPPGTFSICVSPGPPPVTNNDPCGAIELPVGTTCNFSTFTNAGATATTGVGVPPCGAYAGSDVWFKITVPASGSVYVNANYGTMFNGDMAIYRGTCTALTLVACDDNSSPNAPMPAIGLTGQIPGSTLWIRFWGNANEHGTFRLCASLPPPPTVQDCPGAIPICQSIYHEDDSYEGVGIIGNEINPLTSCLEAGERSDVWYTFTVQNSGNLNFTITPNNFSEDYDWQVFNITGHTCAELFTNTSLSVSCNFSATGGNTGPTGGSTLTSQDAAGTPFNAQIPVFAGQTYMLNVSNYSLSTNGYTLNFTASTASIFDNTPPFLQSVNSSTTCGGSQLSVNFSENVLCSTLQNADFAVTGPGGPYTVTGWASASCTSGAQYGNNIDLTVSPAITSSGAFQVCLTTAANSVTDLCGNVAPPACLNFNINVATPAFAPIAPFCAGATAPSLPTTSINGITGTWNPATVNNTTTGTYTFTPAAGQCAATTSVTITVNPGGTPVFNAIPPICAGSAPPVLPTTSANGVTGTWNPVTVSNTASGTYIFTPTGGSCANTASVFITVSSAITPVFNAIAPFCEGATAPILSTVSTNGISGTWSPATVSNSSSGTYTFTPAAGQCGTGATLMITVTPSSGSTNSATICSGNLPYSWNGQSYTAAGSYSVTLSNNAGCDSVAVLNLSVTASSIPAFAPIATFCAGSPAPVLPTTSINGFGGTWSPSVVSNITSGNYIFTPNNACATGANLFVTVTPAAMPAFTPFAPICAGAPSPTLPSMSNDGISGTWSPSIVSTLSSGSYTFTPNSGQCAVATVLSITVNPLPAAPQTNSPVIYCQNQPTISLVNAVFNSPGTLTWYTSPSGGTGSGSAPVPSGANAGTTNYYVSRTLNNCEGPRSLISVQVNAAPNLGADKSLDVCFGKRGNLAALYNFPGMTGIWTLNNAQVSNPVSVSVAGNYQLIVQNSNGCTDTANTQLMIVPLPQTDAGNDSVVEYNIPFQLSGSGGGQYLWSPAAPLNNPFAANPVAVLTRDEVFVLTVVNNAGCENTDTVKIKVLNGPAIHVPSAFTPNGDGINDLFRPVAVGIEKINFKVFNRYGQLIFETQNSASGWDGTYRGRPQPLGNYVWNLKATDRKGVVKEMTGNVILIR